MKYVMMVNTVFGMKGRAMRSIIDLERKNADTR